MSHSLSRWQAVLLGLVVLTALGLGIMGLFAVGAKQWPGGGSIHVTAGFADIAGVEVGTRVRIQGLDAGDVEAILPPAGPGQAVQLRLRLAGKLRHLVTADAQVQIQSEGLLAGKVVRLIPGQGQPADDEAVLVSLPTVNLADQLAQTAGKLDSVLSRADQDLSTALGKMTVALDEIRNGDGTIGKLVKTNEAYSEAVKSMQDVRRMVASVKQNSDAVKTMPLVRNYVVDINKELIRPECQRQRKVFAETDLFEPGRAVLTEQGRQRLDDVAPWVNESKETARSEVVVAAFADPAANPDFAQTLTHKQAEAVTDYLKANHRIHRTGWWYWQTRPVRFVGCGSSPSPVPETQSLPPSRVELLVFAPEQ